MITLEEAQERIAAAIRPLPNEEVVLADALGRYLASPIYSPIDLPPSDNSAMDGYAVRASDLVTTPVALRLIGKAVAGSAQTGNVEPGTCARVFTGAMLPKGADAVVRQESVKKAFDQPGKIIFTESIKSWENARLRGEDLPQKAMLADSGEVLTAQRLSLLAAAGISGVPTGCRPVIGILAIGDELREAGRPLPPGMIYESNRAGLAALARQAGAAPKIYPLVADDIELTKTALEAAFQECDAIVTSGGFAAEEMDGINRTFTEMGGKLDLWQVAVRPGKPFGFGQLGEKILFGLPGNPVSALVTFFLLVRPGLLRFQGARYLQAPKSWGKLSEPLANPGEQRHFLRVIIDMNGGVKSAGGQASHILGSTARANALLDMPPGANWPDGMLVPVLRWSETNAPG